MRFIVRDKNGNDVTNLVKFYIDQNGNLYFLTNDVDDPLQDAMEMGYAYEIIS